MKPVQVAAHVDKDGKLEFANLPILPPGEDLSVLILDSSYLAAFEKMVEIVANDDAVDPELLQYLEALDEALWDMQFANSTDVLKKLADEALAEHLAGQTVELDLEELKRKDP